MVGNISALCKKRGISLAELERQCDLKPRTIYRWDSNTPSVDKVKAVADFFDVTVDSILDGGETKE